MSTKFKNEIREHMPVFCSENEQFGTVDRVEGDSLKLTKDESGQHHFIPLSWVTRVENGSVYVDRPGSQVMREWSTRPLTAASR